MRRIREVTPRKVVVGDPNGNVIEVYPRWDGLWSFGPEWADVRSSPEAAVKAAHERLDRRGKSA